MRRWIAVLVLVSGCASSRLATEREHAVHDAAVADVLMIGGVITTIGGGGVVLAGAVSEDGEVKTGLVLTGIATLLVGSVIIGVARGLWPDAQVPPVQVIDATHVRTSTVAR